MLNVKFVSYAIPILWSLGRLFELRIPLKYGNIPEITDLEKISVAVFLIWFSALLIENIYSDNWVKKLAKYLFVPYIAGFIYLIFIYFIMGSIDLVDDLLSNNYFLIVVPIFMFFIYIFREVISYKKI